MMAASLLPACLRRIRDALPAMRAIAVCGLLGAGIGGLSWGDHGVAWLLLLLPLVYAKAGSRGAAFALLLAYYLGAARGLPAGAAVFFGAMVPWWMGWAFWLVSAVLLAAPYAWFWSSESSRRGLGFAVALGVVALPPIGLIGWCNPAAMAGELFPGAGWWGLLGAVGLFGWLAAGRFADYRWMLGGSAALFAWALNLVWLPPAVPEHWRGFNTEFSRLSSGGADDAGQLLAAMQRVQWLNSSAPGVPAKATLVLPETLLGPFGGLAESQLSAAEHALSARGARILVGAEVPQPDGRYINGLVVLGAGGFNGTKRVVISQSVPVPVSMWKPFASDGAVADVLGRELADLGGQRVGAVICYEQLLPWVMVLRASARPSVMLAVSNIWWARNTSIPGIQRQTVRSFARLFRWPVVSAVNT